MSDDFRDCMETIEEMIRFRTADPVIEAGPDPAGPTLADDRTAGPYRNGARRILLGDRDGFLAMVRSGEVEVLPFFGAPVAPRPEMGGAWVDVRMWVPDRARWSK